MASPRDIPKIFPVLGEPWIMIAVLGVSGNSRSRNACATSREGNFRHEA